MNSLKHKLRLTPGLPDNTSPEPEQPSPASAETPDKTDTNNPPPTYGARSARKSANGKPCCTKSCWK